MAAPIQGERPDQLVLALVRREPPDEQDVRLRGLSPVSHPGEVDDRGNDDVRAELGPVEETHAGHDVAARGVLRELPAPELALQRDRRVVVPQPAGGRDIVRQQQLAVRQVQDAAQARRVGGVVDEQPVAGRRIERAQRLEALRARVDERRDVAPAPAPPAAEVVPKAGANAVGTGTSPPIWTCANSPDRTVSDGDDRLRAIPSRSSNDKVLSIGRRSAGASGGPCRA